LNIKIIKIDKDKKHWMNPCIPYNIGFNQITNDVIIIQNPECIHMGNIIESVKKNIEGNTYLTYACYSVDKNLTELINNVDKEENYVENIKNVIEPYNNISCDNRTNGWYNHSIYRRSMLHFCSAITRSDLYDLGGFDERYANGLAWDDNEFLERIHKKGMNIKIIDNPSVIHQCHVDAYIDKTVPYEITQVNYRLYNQVTKRTNEYDVKKYNQYYK